MRMWKTGAIVSLTLVLASQPANGDAFTISQWYHGVGIDAPHGYDGASWTEVENPCHRTISAQVANSSSSSILDFAWWDTNGTFLIQSTQVAEGVPTSYLSTGSSGGIWVTPAVDLSLTIDAQWTFDLPRYYMDTTLLVSVYGVNSHLSLFSQNTGGQTSYPDPASGTVAITGNVVLPPTDTWVLRYDMNIKTFSGTQGHTATGNGYVNFQLSPEPASVALVALGLLILTRCRHHICPPILGKVECPLFSLDGDAAFKGILPQRPYRRVPCVRGQHTGWVRYSC